MHAAMPGWGSSDFWFPSAVFAQTLPVSAVPQTQLALHASYDTYAAGMHVAEVETGFNFGPWTYRMSLGYHTTGVVGVFFHGHQFDQVEGAWQGRMPRPPRSSGRGSGAAGNVWRRSITSRASRWSASWCRRTRMSGKRFPTRCRPTPSIPSARWRS